MGKGKLPEFRKVYKDSFDHDCYELPGRTGHFHGDRKTAATPPVVFSHYMIDGYFFQPGRDGVVGHRRVIRRLDEATAQKQYDELRSDSGSMENDLNSIVTLGGLQNWFGRMKDGNSDMWDFRTHTRDMCEKSLWLAAQLYGRATRLRDIERKIRLDYCDAVRLLDRRAFESETSGKISDVTTCVEFQAELLTVDAENSPEPEFQKIPEETIRKIVGAFNHVCLVAHKTVRDLKQDICVLYRPIDKTTEREKGERPVILHSTEERRIFFGELIHRVIGFGGRPVCPDEYRERLYVLVTLLKALNPQRMPFFVNGLIDKIYLNHLLVFSAGLVPNSKTEIPIKVNILLPHTARRGHKGYAFVLIPNCLVPEAMALFSPKMESWKKNGGKVPYTFGSHVHGRDLPTLGSAPRPGCFPTEDYKTWFREFQLCLQLRHIITPHTLKKHYFSDGLISKIDAETRNRMRVVNNTDLEIVLKHYRFADVDGYLIDPGSLAEQEDIMRQFEDLFRDCAAKSTERIRKTA